MNSWQINQVLHEYCDNELSKLRQVCYPVLIKIGGISDKDYDDFYSIALEVLSDSVFKFDDDKECSFQTFLTSNIKRKFNTEVRDRNRKKRIPAKQIQSINSLVGDDGLELSELIPSNFDVFEEACGENFAGTKIERYFDRLSAIQREIVSLLSSGYKARDIREYLHMTAKEYSQNLAAIQAYENVRVLM